LENSALAVSSTFRFGVGTIDFYGWENAFFIFFILNHLFFLKHTQ
jgi:hypothetical protein